MEYSYPNYTAQVQEDLDCHINIYILYFIFIYFYCPIITLIKCDRIYKRDIYRLKSMCIREYYIDVQMFHRFNFPLLYNMNFAGKYKIEYNLFVNKEINNDNV